MFRYIIILRKEISSQIIYIGRKVFACPLFLEV